MTAKCTNSAESGGSHQNFTSPSIKSRPHIATVASSKNRKQIEQETEDGARRKQPPMLKPHPQQPKPRSSYTTTTMVEINDALRLTPTKKPKPWGQHLKLISAQTNKTKANANERTTIKVHQPIDNAAAKEEIRNIMPDNSTKIKEIDRWMRQTLGMNDEALQYATEAVLHFHLTTIEDVELQFMPVAEISESRATTEAWTTITRRRSKKAPQRTSKNPTRNQHRPQLAQQPKKTNQTITGAPNPMPTRNIETGRKSPIAASNNTLTPNTSNPVKRFNLPSHTVVLTAKQFRRHNIKSQPTTTTSKPTKHGHHIRSKLRAIPPSLGQLANTPCSATASRYALEKRWKGSDESGHPHRQRCKHSIANTHANRPMIRQTSNEDKRYPSHNPINTTAASHSPVTTETGQTPNNINAKALYHTELLREISHTSGHPRTITPTHHKGASCDSNITEDDPSTAAPADLVVKNG